MAALAVGFSTLAWGALPALADEADANAKAESPAAAETRERGRDRREAKAEETAALAAREAEAERDARDQEARDQEAQYCRRVKLSGSRIPKRVCTTAGRDDRQERAAEDFLRRQEERSTIQRPADGPYINSNLPGF